MPIRFRCAYCNQLMGIARRKAGTVVRCPSCAGQVIVPHADGAGTGTGKAALPGQPGAEPIFERSDFEEALHSASGGKHHGAVPATVPPSAVPGPQPIPRAKETGGRYEVDRIDFPSHLPSPSKPPGIYLSAAMATLLSVALVIALALAFTAGLVVGRFLFGAPSEQTEQAHATTSSLLCGLGSFVITSGQTDGRPAHTDR